MTVEELKQKLHLAPHPREGGYFVQTWKSDATIPESALAGYSGPRATGSAIYYLLEPGTFSEMHRLRSDEVFHFYLGDPVEMLQLWPDGSSRTVILGSDLAGSMTFQAVVPRNIWQGSRLLPGGSFALLGCTVSPGFEYEDYDAAGYEELTRGWPDQAERIRLLTRF